MRRARTLALLFLSACDRSPRTPAIPDSVTADMQAPVAELIGEARAAVVAEPGSAAAWGRLGMVLDAHHLYGDAAACYERAHELDPAEFRWAYFLPIVLDHGGAPAETIVRQLADAAQLEPGHAPLHARFGETLARSGRLAEAGVSYERAIELAPRFPIAHRGLGQVALATGDAAGALVHIERAIAIQDGDRGAYAALAQACRQLGMADRARAAAARASQLPDLYTYLDRIRAEVGSLGVSTTVLVDRAKFRMGTGQWDLALQDLRIAERAAPDDEWVQRQLARALRELGDAQQAALHEARADTLAGRR